MTEYFRIRRSDEINSIVRRGDGMISVVMLVLPMKIEMKMLGSVGGGWECQLMILVAVAV